MAVFTTQRHIAVMREIAAKAALDRVDQAARRLEDLLHTVRSDVLTLAEWPIWESYLSAHKDSDRTFWREKLVVQLRTFADLKPAYKSVVYSDEIGADVLRATRKGTATIVRRADAPLSPWAQKVIVRTAQLAPRQTHWEFVGDQYRSTLICASPAALRQTHRRSAVWLELDAASLFEIGAPREADQSSLALFDDEGRLRFARQPAALNTLASKPSRQYVDSHNRLVSVAVVSIFPGQGVPRWRLALIEPAAVLNAGVHDFRAAFLGVMGLALLIATILSVWLARQFVQPLRRVYQASQRIGRGDFDVQLSDTTGDEIGALAEQINMMAGQLQAAHEDFERRLSDKTEQLIHAERLSTIGRTAAAVAHEINNPSGIISMYAQMLAERLTADDPNLEKLQVIKDKAREISRIVNELLDYSRKPAPKKEWVDSHALITKALHDAAMVQTDGDAASPIVRTIDVDADAEKLYVDPHQMRRVLRNLVNNACQAMPAGGELRVRCRRGHDEGVTIEIADTGTGMDSEQLRHLFDPFYTTKRFGAGTGLGLAISKEITERHGGTVRVESEPGRGTAVTLWLPEAPTTYEI